MHFAISGTWVWYRKTEGEHPPSGSLSLLVIVGIFIILALEPVDCGRFLFGVPGQSGADSVTRNLAVIGSFLSGFGSSTEI